MLLSAGTRLGSFEIVSIVGVGGMGEVYRARDTRLGRIVAVKILRQDKIANRQRFQREAAMISRLSHPNICAVHDVGEHNGTPFLVMEHLEGQTLAERLDDGAIPLVEALRHSVEICAALSEAHNHGIVHRDVKPGNVVVTREGVKLLDFGLAKLRQAEAEDASLETIESLNLTEGDGILGTVSYMAPEQLEARQVDARTDLFGVGAMIYEMVTGRRPFGGTSRAGVIAAILTSDPVAMSTFRPDTPSTLDRVVRRCLARNPDDRWQTASDLGWELKSIASETAHTSGLAKERKGRAILASALIGVSLFAAVAVAAWILKPDDASQPSYQRLTFRRGIVSSARFGPDGQTVIFSAAWDGRPYELFMSRIGSAESRPLGMSSSRILSVSATGEMAVLFGPQSFTGGVGTLSRASLAGGAHRELLAGVTEADWGPDGSIAVVRRSEGGMAIEFPIGTKLHEAPAIWSMRVSPDGNRVAFFESQASPGAVLGEVVVVDRSRRRTTLTKPLSALGLAWPPRGDEVWFSGARSDGPPAIRAVSLTGKERIVERVPAPLMLGDISPDGRVLLIKGMNLGGIACRVPGDTREREVGWLENARVESLSATGTTLLFGATEGNWRGGVYTRGTNGSPAVRLGDGHPESISPDGQWVLARAPGAGTAWGREWALVPTGPGTARLLPRGTITQIGEGAWLPDGKRVVFTAIESGRASRVYVQDVESGSMRSVTPEGVRMPERAATPDGTSVLVQLGRKWFLHPIEVGEPQPLPVIGPGDHPLQWSTDGRYLYVAGPTDFVPPVAIERVDVRTGRREPWTTLVPPDPVGIERLDPPVLTPDGRGYCYSYARRHQELYAVEGLR